MDAVFVYDLLLEKILFVFFFLIKVKTKQRLIKRGLS